MTTGRERKSGRRGGNLGTGSAWARIAAAAALLVVIGVAPPVRAALTLEQVGAWGGQCRSVRLMGDRAYLSLGGSVELLDLSNPAEPVRLSQARLPSTVYDLSLDGALVFAGMQDDGVRIVDFSVPAWPQTIGAFTALPLVRDVAAGGGHLYVATSGGHPLQILNVEDPASPALLAPYGGLSAARTVAFADGIAYVGGDDPVVHIVDMANPTAPLTLNVLPLAGRAERLALSGDYLFTPEFDDGLGIHRVRNTPQPVTLFEQPLGASALGVAAVGDMAALLTTGSFALLDVSDPGQPEVRAEFAGLLNPWDVDTDGSLTLLADREIGLGIFDTSELAATSLVGFVPTAATPSTIALRYGYAYVGDRESGLHVVDAADPANPRWVRAMDEVSRVMRIRLDGDLAYVAVDAEGLAIYDVSEPADPQFVSMIDTPGLAQDVKVRDGRAYVADVDSVRVFDVSEPSTPLPLGASTGSRQIYALDFAGEHLVAADASGLLVVFERPADGSLNEVASLPLAGLPYDVAVQGGTAYVACDAAGIAVVDVTDAAAPSFVRQVPTGGFALGLRLTERYLFVGNDEDGVRVFDISRPQQPKAAATAPTAGLAWGLDLQDEHLFVADWLGGLTVFELEGALGACCRRTVCGSCTSGQCQSLAPYTCDARALMAESWTGCHGDVDGNGRVNAADRGHIAANLGTTDSALVCRYDLNGDGLVNTDDRDVVLTLIGRCEALPDFQDGSGMNGGEVDPRFGVEPDFRGVGSLCPATSCLEE